MEQGKRGGGRRRRKKGRGNKEEQLPYLFHNGVLIKGELIPVVGSVELRVRWLESTLADVKHLHIKPIGELRCQRE